MATQASRHVIGDTPERGKYLIFDGEVTTICEGGLAFALGVACLEAELVCDFTRFWQVQHPNGVAIYHVCYMPSGEVIMRNVGSNPHVTKV